jgi:DNA-binding CsgD family transcriptional regulator
MTLGDAWPLVGRDAELDRLTRLLLDAESDDRPVVVIEGELGVGKTRLLDEVAERGRARGFAVCGGGVSRQRVVRLAQSGRVLLIVDDVPRAGRAAINLVTSLIGDLRAVRVVVLLACRTAGLPVALAQALSGVRWLRLANLPAPDVDRLLGTEPAARRRALYRASGGNPRYLEILAGAPDETLAELANPAVLNDEQVGTALDRGITSELRALDEIQRSVVHAAAVLGAELDLELVAEVAQLTGVTVAGAVDELVCAGYLRDGAGRLEFVHPLVRAAAYRLAGPGTRLLAHQSAARCLRRRGASVTRQAHHLEHAAQAGDTVAADVLATAARTMLGLAPATSVRWLRKALRVLPQRPDLSDLQSSLRVRLATALVASGQLAQARAELSDLRGLTGNARTAAVRLLAKIARLLGDLPAARGLAKAELHRTETPDCRPGLHFELLLADLLAGRRLATGNGPVVAAAHRHPGLHAAAAGLFTLSAAPGGQLAELLERLRCTAELVDGLDDGTLSDVLEVTVPLGWLELLVDRISDALRHVDRGIALAQRNGQRHVVAQLYPVRVLAHCRTGAIAESLRAADNAVAAASAIGSTEMVTFARLVRLRPLWLREGAAAASHAVNEVAAAPRLGSTWHRLVADARAAEVLLAVDRVDECLARLRPWLDTGSATVSALTPGWYALVGQAHLAAGDVAGARTWLDRATAHVADTPLAGQLGEVAAAEAAVLLAERRVAAAVGRARAAAEHFASVGFVVRAAQARMTLAEAQWRGGQVAEARRELGHARAALVDAGADSLAARAARAQSRLGARLPRPTCDLTTREREIADLIAHGMTNREIAATLYLSPRTVDAHVRRILAKLGVPTRAAIVRHLAT